MKTEVHFHSMAFNCTESKDYFINPCCWGDDVCRWLISGLRAETIKTDDEPGQEDFGWYFCFEAGGCSHCFVVGFQPSDPDSGDQWLGWIERDVGLVCSLFGGRKRGIKPEAVEAIDRALQSHPAITNIS